MRQTLRKTFARKALMLVALLVGAVNGAWAEDVVFDFTQSNDAYGSGVTPLSKVDLTEGETTFTNGGVTIKYTTKGGSTNLRWWTDGVRAYNGNVFTIEAADAEIASIAIEGSIVVEEVSTTGGSISSNTWTAPSVGGVSSVAFKGNHTSGNRTITKVPHYSLSRTTSPSGHRDCSRCRRGTRRHSWKRVRSRA